MTAPTDEQRRAVALAASGRDGAITARAGTGKTTTLEAAAHATAPTPATLVAFNRAIAREARARVPRHVHATTLHALAFRAVVAPDPRLRAKFEAAVAGPAPATYADLFGLDASAPGTARHVAHLRAVLRTFAASADPAPDVAHVPAPLAARLARELGPERAAVRTTWLARRAARAWVRILDPADPAPLDHDAYLKLFAARGGPVPGELLLIDEAQDLAPVMLTLLEGQDAVRLLVGDSAQRIYGFRGAIDAMAASDAPQVHLTRSFRFGPAIAEAAHRVLAVVTADPRLTGAGPDGALLDDGDACPPGPRTVLCRTGAGVLDAALRHGEGGVHVVGGVAGVTSTLRAAHALWAARHDPAGGDGPRVAGVATWEALVQAGEDGDADLRTLRRLVERYGADTPAVAAALERSHTRRERDAATVVATIHRAKGREWDHVALGPDLPRIAASRDAVRRAPDPDAARSEANLAYVAVTRARRTLDVRAVRDEVRALLLGAEP
ncbi:MAG: AAA family ATPase [Trueperaceae bacterium]|nr:AAA family ATPase [Trueperaceae bacterium]